MGRCIGALRSATLDALVAGALVLQGCGEETTGPLVFSVGGASSELVVWEELARSFEVRSGIEVEILRQPSDTTQQRQHLVLALHSGQSNPDVLMMDVAWIGLFARAGWLESLDTDPSPFFRGIVESVDTHEGELVALPVYVDGGVLYYRVDLLDTEPPETWTELRRTAARVQARERAGNPDFYGFVWQGAQYEGLVCTFLEFAGSRGGFLETRDRLLVDVPANHRAVQLMHDLIWRDRISPPGTYTEMREEEVRKWFQSGDALFERNWPYAWSAHQGRGSGVKGKVGVAPLPAPERGEAVSTLGGWHIGVSRASDRKEEARRFVGFVTSAETQREMVRRLGWNPGRSDLYEDPEVLADNPHFAGLQHAFRNARPRPTVPYYPQVSRVLQRALNAVLARRSGAVEALSRAQEQIDAMARRYAGKGGGR